LPLGLRFRSRREGSGGKQESADEKQAHDPASGASTAARRT